jgi:hypothetical protein
MTMKRSFNLLLLCEQVHCSCKILKKNGVIKYMKVVEFTGVISWNQEIETVLTVKMH